MLKELETELNWTFTENGALAYYETKSSCLDFFSQAGALRNADRKRAESLFWFAYAENPDDAMRILFYLRDVRGGLGERRLFRVLLRFAAFHFPESVKKNLKNIPEYGRFDDCLVLLNTPCESVLVEMIKSQLDADIADMQNERPVSLMAKWLPSVNTSGSVARKQAKQLCKLLHLPEKTYRKTLSQLRTYLDVLEKRLCARDYTFDYKKLPSRALYKYKKAFMDHDSERYEKFLNRVERGRAVLKSGNIFPYEIVRDCITLDKFMDIEYYSGTDEDSQIIDEQRLALDFTWNSLPDYTDCRNTIAVIDGSSSMYFGSKGSVRPVTIAVSLGIYLAERSKGHFHDCFITFSENPRLVSIRGTDIVSKVQHCMSYNECENTNLQRVFELLLNTAVKHNLPQEELPEIIYIISDTEFDIHKGTDKTIFQFMKDKFKKAGYKLPIIVYWNVESRNKQYPVRKDETGAVLVSGCSPAVFRYALNLQMTPEKFMRSVLDDERYRGITA